MRSRLLATQGAPICVDLRVSRGGQRLEESGPLGWQAMFTGIVQSIGTVRLLRPAGSGVRLVLDAPRLRRPIADGASVCVSGACLTVVQSDSQTIEFDVIGETLNRSTLGSLKAGDRVNLETSLRVGDALDGHWVQGHVDAVASVRHIDGDHVVTLEAPADVIPYIVPKGSIAIDGVSLTVVAVFDDRFNVALIPTTLAATTLSGLRVGNRVNIETDIVARTVVTTLQRWREAQSGHGVTMEMLREQGYA